MNKLIRLSPTGIEYGDYAWNFASGCGNNIDGKCKAGGFRCWAYSISQRFEDHYPNGFKPTIYPEALCSPVHLKKPSRILCAFMGDLFGDCPEFDPDKKIHAVMPSGKVSISMSLKGWIFTTIKQCPQHTFVFLTKQPQNLIKFSPFPDNCWVGVTATDLDMAYWATYHLKQIEASVKYISFEPLLSWKPTNGKFFEDTDVDWLIIGAQTRPAVFPRIECVKEIVQSADKAGIPVFLKDNLKPLIESQCNMNDQWAAKEWVMCKYPVLRQEMPQFEPRERK